LEFVGKQGTFTFFCEESNKETFRETTQWIKPDNLRVLRWGTEISKLSGTMKISENARGKTAAKLLGSCQLG